MKRSLISLVGAAAILGLSGAASASINLILNPSFESDTNVDPITDWSTNFSNAEGFDVHSIQTGGAEDGNNFYLATTGPAPVPGYGENVVSQTFADTPGQEYTLSFWLEYSGPTTGIGGPDQFAITGIDSLGSPTISLSDEGWTNYTDTFTGSGSDTAGFSYILPVSSTLGLDNVSVTPDAVVTPEPGTPVTLALGLLSIGSLMVARRRKREITL